MNGKAFLAISLISMAQPAHAERLLFDHRANPDLKAVLDRKNDRLIHYEEKNGRAFDRIVLQGQSAETDDWTEALEITVSKRQRNLHSPADWFTAFRRLRTPCPVEWSALASDELSLTFTGIASACAGRPARTAFYRVVLGQGSVYLLAAIVKGEVRPLQQQRWFALLVTARVEN